MSRNTSKDNAPGGEDPPPELVELRDRLLSQPAEIRAELGPLVDEAIEDAYFRKRAMTLARDALARFRLHLALAEFDLEVSRRERERYKAMMESD